MRTNKSTDISQIGRMESVVVVITIVIILSCHYAFLFSSQWKENVHEKIPAL